VNLYCDNYTSCNSYVLDQGGQDRTEYRARARGWHIFHGTDHSGRQHDAVLCGHCVDDRRRALNPAPPLQPGQQTLFEIVAVIDETP
jgi:hypothetical protein